MGRARVGPMLPTGMPSVAPICLWSGDVSLAISVISLRRRSGSVESARISTRRRSPSSNVASGASPSSPTARRSVLARPPLEDAQRLTPHGGRQPRRDRRCVTHGVRVLVQLDPRRLDGVVDIPGRESE
jgi:hypothetical protein